MSDIATLVLAAGKSTRMNSIKQLVKIDAKTLLEITLEKAKKIAPKKTFCVLGANANKIIDEINFEATEIIINKNFDNGLSSSIIKGLDCFNKKYSEIKKVLILLADQPAIHLSYLEEMVVLSHKYPTKIIASKYNKTFGVPALIPSIYFDNLQKITGDKGAKTFLNNNQFSVISPKKNTNLFDIDTLAQLKQFINS